MQGKVVIVTRTKNRPLLLQRCVQSVLGQTYPNWLHVIVNDGGDPATVDGIVARFASRYQARIKVIHNENSVGMQNASNLAIHATESEFLTIHDDDDSWKPLFLETCVRHLESVGADAIEQGVVTQSAWISEEIDSHGKVTELSRQDYYPFEHVSLFVLAARNLFPPIAFLYRRKVHEAIGYFDQTFNELGDHDFNIRFVARYEIGVLSAQLAGYHWRHQANGSSYGNTVTDGVASHKRTLVKMHNHYLRKDLADQKMGIGFLINMAGNFENQAGWIHGLATKSENVTRILTKTTRKLDYYDRLLSSLFTPWKSKALPWRLYDHVADWMGKDSAKTNGHANPSALRGQLQQAKVVSLDVFDTTLLRLVRKPTDLFLYIQADVRRLLNRPNLGFVEVRVAAEEASREEMRRTRQISETTLDGIYLALQKLLGCDEAIAKQIQRLELQAEYKLCFAHPEITQLVAQANKDKKIIFASDMYLPASEITGLLERNGFKDLPLFVSSELSTSKSEGGLFDHVMGQLQSSPADLLHIGDNIHSDVERPRAKGISAHHWTSSRAQLPLVDQHNSLSGAWDGDLASSLYTGLVRRRRLTHPLEKAHGKAFWQMLGYEVIGPLYHAFISWTIARAKKRDVKKLFFLARDGFQLAKVFELFKEKQNLAMQGEYLFASRRLLNLPRIERLDEESLIFLITPNPAMCAGDFLRRIDLDPTQHEALLRKHGFKNIHERITTKGGIFKSEEVHQGMRRVMRELEVSILELARQERKKLLAYLEQSGLHDKGSAIVDIGWQGSSLRSLNQLLSRNGEPANIPGFYFGTWQLARSTINADCTLESFFMHLEQPQHRAGILMESVELIESFFSAPHPTITGLVEKNGAWEPVYGQPEVDVRTQTELAIATETAFEFIRDALDVWPDSGEFAPAFGYLETTLERLLRYPHKDEAEVLGKFSLRNSFGGKGPLRHVAVLPPAWERISKKQSLQEAYDHCYWKKGFLAQLSPRTQKHLKI